MMVLGHEHILHLPNANYLTILKSKDIGCHFFRMGLETFSTQSFDLESLLMLVLYSKLNLQTIHYLWLYHRDQQYVSISQHI